MCDLSTTRETPSRRVGGCWVNRPVTLSPSLPLSVLYVDQLVEKSLSLSRSLFALLSSPESSCAGRLIVSQCIWIAHVNANQSHSPLSFSLRMQYDKSCYERVNQVKSTFKIAHITCCACCNWLSDTLHCFFSFSLLVVKLPRCTIDTVDVDGL